ncbi:hypothetical protein [Hyphomicrobium sp. CS1GBMeth3]|uniref:hypothetical protein n=1 Tax=Hyphomicrobium sp. CS1GBMeth3 TaxID=1892845 RepID=UPI000931FB43|nr:hypothetical protein [Hyphomicrobium sp. CS1GBMeth3]
MIALDTIIGNSKDIDLADRLHKLDHDGRVEWILMKTADFGRRRLLSVTDRGSQCAITLPRAERLFDGAVLMLTEDRAIVVRAEPERWLEFGVRDAAAALELGYFAGNMHWTVRFDGPRLCIAAGAEPRTIVDRLQHLIDRGSVHLVDDAT